MTCGRPTRTAAFQGRVKEALCLLATLAAAVSLVLFAHYIGMVLCPLKRFTGIPCPTCGATRALVKLLPGEFAAAFLQQPLAMTGIFMAGSLYLLSCLSQRPRRFLAQLARHPLAWVLAALAVAANWAYVIRIGN